MDYSQIPLRDLQMPEVIGWWPFAYGWWILLMLLICCFVFFVCYIRKKLKNPRRYALLELKKIEHAYLQNKDAHKLLIETNDLLKRLALSLYPRERVASLSGEDWRLFLQESGNLPSSDALESLVQGPYQKQGVVSVEHTALLQLCRLWIKQVQGAGHA